MLSALLAPEIDVDVAPDFELLRRREFARLDANGHAYLDYTGSALYPESLLSEHQALLRRSVFGNPHAENPASLSSTHVIGDARQRILGYLDADPAEYAVCFAANATGALGLVGSAFQFGTNAPFILTTDNHNSVNGIREFARRRGATVNYLPLDKQLRLDASRERMLSIEGRGLFAFPAQSNFSGVRHSLSLVHHAQALGHRVLLDAAAYLPMSRLSLRETPADFVAISFYKMFGYPTGVGALVARRDALAELERPWFSGGTVEFVSVQNNIHALRSTEEAFEDGTANFLGISAIAGGLDFLESIGTDNIERHASALAMQLIKALSSRAHRNGAPIAEIYGPGIASDRGATVAFNLLDEKGASVPFAAVERRAHTARVSVRGGCFCNPGASEAAFRFPAEATARCLQSVEEFGWSIDRFAECLEDRPVGAIRASFGAPSSARDLQRLLAVIDSFTG